MDSTKSPNNNNHNHSQNHHPNPLVHYHPSSEHGRTSAFNVPPTSSQTIFSAPNSHSSFPSRNLARGYNNSASLGQPLWVNNNPGIEEINLAMGGFCLLSSEPGMQNIQSAMGGLSLSSDPATRNRSTCYLSNYFLNDDDDFYREFLDEFYYESEDDMELEIDSDDSSACSVLVVVGGNSNRVLASP